MANYPTVKNPLLQSSPPPRRSTSGGPSSVNIKGLSSASFRNFFSKSFHQLSTASSQIRLGGSSHKRIGPSSSFTDTKVVKKQSSAATKGASSDPLVHYNGPCDTLDQLPDEKLAWIKQEPVSAEGLRHPLLDCSGSIVLRKPVTRSQTL